MADDIINTVDDAAQNETASQKRIRELSESVKTTAQERDEKDNLLKESATKIATLEKENIFNSGFADVLGTQPLAKDHKDEIKAKVLSGYSVKDATWAVLGEAGKLGNPVQQVQVAGGSAITNPQSGAKDIKDMTQEERRAILDKDLLWN